MENFPNFFRPHGGDWKKVKPYSKAELFELGKFGFVDACKKEGISESAALEQRKKDHEYWHSLTDDQQAEHFRQQRWKFHQECIDNNPIISGAKKIIYKYLDDMPKHRESTIGSWHGNTPLHKSILRKCKNIIDGTYFFALMTGNSGTGKTHLAWGIAKQLALKGKSVYYKDFGLLKDMFQQIFKGEISLYELLLEINEHQLFIIDDFNPAVEYNKQIKELAPQYSENFFTIIKKRDEMELQTLIISNQTRNALAISMPNQFKQINSRLKKGRGVLIDEFEKLEEYK